ncbi:MAG: type IV toxin-antitoxin system AbiEi family antitoxin domain-containing protein [Candidatus Omnitrophota bacterium]
MDKEEQLSEYANNQSGYFTAQQAQDAGYSYRLHSYHVKTGKWVKAGRGVFRLRSFPPAEREDLVQWTLWSRDRKGHPQAVASNETALAIHELGDVMPAKFHFTVPPAFRKKPPKGCVLYTAKLEENDREQRQGYSVTTPLRTLVDVAEGDLSEDELAKALRDALDKGLVQLKKIDVTQMTGKGKLRMLMAIKAVKERKAA